jgi:hypothetical protein
MRLRLFILVLLFCTAAESTVIDRIAVVVGNRAVKDSDIERDIRITSLLNREKPDFSTKSRRDSANRLIDQQLIRREIEIGQYAVPPASEAARLLAQIKKDRFRAEADYQRALSEYGITEAELKSQLLWQLTVLRFIDARFRPGVLVTEEDVQKYYREHAPAWDGLQNVRQQVEETIAGERINQQFYAWLEMRRKMTKVVFREETLR